MNHDNYFVIGGSELQFDFIKEVRKAGYNVHVIDYDPDCPGASVADAFHCISIDDTQAVLKLAEKYKPVAIHTIATEQGNVTACYVSEKLGLKSNSYKTALATTDKSLMKEVCYRHEIPTPYAQVLKSLKDIDCSTLDFPLMVKASDRSAGRGIQLVYNESELASAFDEAVSQSLNGLVLLEEYYDAPQFSVETVTSAGKHQVVAITEQWFDGPPFFAETGHCLPAKLAEEKKKYIEAFCLKILNAFNVQYGACHIEVRVNKEEIKLIEIASRMGGWRHWMVDCALGINYLHLTLNASLGKRIEKLPDAVTKQYAICAIITNSDDLSRYENFKILHKDKIFIDIVKPEKGVFSTKSLIEARGLYIYKISDDFFDTEFSL